MKIAPLNRHGLAPIGLFSAAAAAYLYFFIAEWTARVQSAPLMISSAAVIAAWLLLLWYQRPSRDTRLVRLMLVAVASLALGLAFAVLLWRGAHLARFNWGEPPWVIVGGVLSLFDDRGWYVALAPLIAASLSPLVGRRVLS